MTVDVLAEFRRPGTAPRVRRKASEAAVSEPTDYHAFGVAAGAAKPSRIEMRAADGMSVARLYSGLAEIVFDRSRCDVIMLIWAGKKARVRGRNLRPVAEALLAGTCEFIAELAPGMTEPNDAVVIERIDDLAAAEKSTASK